MTKSHFKKLAAAVLATVLTGLLAACGGGGDDGAPLVVSGLAATGAPMANSLVSVKCAAGATVSGVTAADGSFNLSLRGGQVMPCLVKVTRGDPEVTHFSLATAAGHVNVTPLTDLALARALGSDPHSAFAVFTADTGARAVAALAAAKTYVAVQILAITGQTPTVDLFSGVFAIGAPDDQILDALGLLLKAADMDVDDLREVAAHGGDLKEAIQQHGDDDDDDNDDDDD